MQFLTMLQQLTYCLFAYDLLLPCALLYAGSKAVNGSSDNPSSFTMEGPMVALLMPFKPDSLEIDDASFIKYLEVGLKHFASEDSLQ